MGWPKALVLVRIVPIGLVVGLIGCAGTNRSISWQEPKPRAPLSNLFASKSIKSETTATIVPLDESGQALPSTGIIADSSPAVTKEGPRTALDAGIRPASTLDDRFAGASAMDMARVTGSPMPVPSLIDPKKNADGDAGGPRSATAPLNASASPSTAIGRFLSRFRRPTVDLPIPPRPPLADNAAMTVKPMNDAETPNAAHPVSPTVALEDEPDVWAESTRSRALAMLEKDRAKAKLKPRVDIWTGKTEMVAVREPETAANANANPNDRESSLLPVSLEIDTKAQAGRAATAKPLDPNDPRMSEAKADASRAERFDSPQKMRRPSQPKPAPWSPYPGQPGAEPEAQAETAQPPSSPVTLEAPSATVEAPADAKPADQPAATAEPAAEANAALEPSATETEPAKGVEAPAEPVAPVVPAGSEGAAAAPPETPRSEIVPDPVLQENLTPAEPPREVATAVDLDRVTLPADIDAESETRRPSKVESATERVSLSDTAAMPAPVVADRILPARSTAIPEPGPAPPAAVTAAEPPLPTPNEPEPVAPNAAVDSKGDTPPVPDAVAESETPVDSAKDKEAESKPAAEADAKKDQTETKEADTKPTPVTPAPAAPASEAAKAPVPAAQTALPPVPPKKRIDFPRWTPYKTLPAAQGPAPASAPPKPLPKAPAKVMPTLSTGPQPPAKSLPKPPSKGVPTAQNQTVLPEPQAKPARIPIWSSYNNLAPYGNADLMTSTTKGRPTESPTAGWKVPSKARGTASTARRGAPTPQAAVASTGTEAIVNQRGRVVAVGPDDVGDLFPATYRQAMTQVTPMPSAGRVDPGARRASTADAASRPAETASSAKSKRPSILSRFLSRFHWEADDTPVPTPADAAAGLVNPQGGWKRKPARPEGYAPGSIAPKPADVLQGGEGVERVSADRVDEPPQR